MTTGSITALAARPGMPSRKKLAELIAAHPDFPVIERGGGRRGFVLDLDAAEAFVRALRGATERAPGTGSLSDLAARAGMPSLSVISDLANRQPGFPVIRRGGRGLEYIVDLDQAEAFVRARLDAAPIDGTGNLSALAARPGMPSLPVISQLVAAHPDFPVIRRRAGGRGYVVQLDAAEAFVRAVWRRRRAATRRPGQLVRA